MPQATYCQDKCATGTSHKEGLRRLADVVYRTMVRDSWTSLKSNQLTGEP